jgi:cellulose synthase/poly-beta-1,6-N-acetylglucosamine synthase-like glycosyltransferase
MRALLFRRNPYLFKTHEIHLYGHKATDFLRRALGVPLSVIIPAHKAVETITDTLDSLLAQTSPAWEAIVVDDGSSDDTAAVAARFAERDARLRLVQQSPHGVRAARNIGISFARYDWGLFLDADDWLAPVQSTEMPATRCRDA